MSTPLNEQAFGSDVVELYPRASEEFRIRVRSVEPKDWQRPTPCSEWDVRALVHHVVEEERWVPPLLGGATIEGMEGRLSGDLLGADPPASVERAAEEAERAVADLRPPEGRVHLSYGEEEPQEYLRQVLADHVVHAWDPAAAVDGVSHGPDCAGPVVPHQLPPRPAGIRLDQPQFCDPVHRRRS